MSVLIHNFCIICLSQNLEMDRNIVVEHLPSVHKSLGSLSITTKIKQSIRQQK